MLFYLGVGGWGGGGGGGGLDVCFFFLGGGRVRKHTKKMSFLFFFGGGGVRSKTTLFFFGCGEVDYSLDAFDSLDALDSAARPSGCACCGWTARSWRRSGPRSWRWRLYPCSKREGL